MIIYVYYGGGLNWVDTGHHIFKTFTSSHLDSEALWYLPFGPISVQPIEFLTTWLLSSSHRLLHRGSPYFARSSCHTICWIYITTSIIIHLLLTGSPCLFCWINAVLKSRPIAIHLDISAHEISCAVPKRFIQTRVWLKIGYPQYVFFQRIISLPPILTRARLCPAVASHLIPSPHPRFPGWEAVGTCWWIPASLSPTSMLRAWPVMRFMSSSHLLCTICIIKGSWEAILPCYGQIKLWDLTLSIGVAASRLRQWFVSRFSHFWRL